MDNRPLLQIGFDGHYVVYLGEPGGEIPPGYPRLRNFNIKERPPDVVPALFLLSEDYRPQAALFF